jgi:hypothetical protein
MTKCFSMAIVTAKGIYINHLFYSNSVAIQEQWFMIAHHFGTWIIPVFYDVNFQDHIEIYHRGELLQAYLIPSNKNISPELLTNYFLQLDHLKSTIQFRRKNIIRRNKKRSERFE